MSDKQKVLVALALLSETCNANIAYFSQSSSSASSSSSAPTSSPTPAKTHSVAVLRKDFLSLLSLVYTSSTKISLTLRPPGKDTAPAYTTALPLINDFTQHVSSLTTCATLFGEHGSTFAGELKAAANDVCEAAQSLAVVLSTALTAAPSTSSPTASLKTKKKEAVEDLDKEYLMRTGAVHETIERIRKELPEDNLAAVRRRWNADKGMLQDTLEDVNGMIEDAAEDADDEDDDEDEGFGSDDDVDGLGLEELGFTNKKLSKVELERVKKIQPLIRICVLLHKRVLLDLLKPQVIPASSYAILDTLPPLSHKLLIATEEIIAALYAPQDTAAISLAITVLENAVQELQETLLQKDLLPPPVTVTSESVDGKKEKDVRKWFETCFEQIHKLYSTI